MLALKSRTAIRRTAIAALATATAAAGLALAAPAHAADFSATVTIENGVLSVAASDGNKDRVIVSNFFDFIQVEDTLIRLNLNVIDPGVSCTQPYAHIIRCAPSGIASVTAQLKDGDDAFTNYTWLPSNVSGGDGNDTLTGGHAKDIFFGGAGVDVLHGGDGSDDLEGGTGQDDVYGDSGADRLTSLYQDDELFGGDGNDTLFSSIDVHGGTGDDTIIMNANLGEYWGDEGGDTIDYSHWRWARISLDGNSNDTGGALLAGDGEHNVHGDVDVIIGTPGDDDLTGNDSPNRFEGGEGSDSLWGRGGNDTLNAGNGSAQRIDGGEGYDRCTGYNLVLERGCD